LRIQVGGTRRLGYIFIKMGLLTDEQLLGVLSDQLELPIIQVEEKFDGAEKRTLPRYLCKKYNVLPLSREKNNVLQLAMMNPMDDEAIADIENFTGTAVKPILARQSDIDRGISKFVPFSLKDIFNPVVSGKAAKVLSVVSVLLILVIGGMTAQYFYMQKYGTISLDETRRTYQNFDLIVGFEQKNGKVSLLGRGAYSQGYYSVKFNDVSGLQRFLEQKHTNFSQNETEWLSWVAGRIENDKG